MQTWREQKEPSQLLNSNNLLSFTVKHYLVHIGSNGHRKNDSHKTVRCQQNPTPPQKVVNNPWFYCFIHYKRSQSQIEGL